MRFADVDLHDPDTFVHGVPHHAFASCSEGGAGPLPQGDGRPRLLCLTKYEDVVTVSKDPHTFSSKRGGTNIQDYSADDLSASS